MIAVFFAVFIIFIVHDRFLFDVLIGGDGVGNEATGSNSIDVMIWVANVLVGFVERVSNV